MEVDQAISGTNHRSSAVRSAGEMGPAVEKKDSDGDDIKKSDKKDCNSGKDESS